MDPLSDVLSLLKLRSYMVGGFDAGGEWSIQLPQYEGIKCYAVVFRPVLAVRGGRSRSGACKDGGLPAAAEGEVFPCCKRSDVDACRRRHDSFGRVRWWHHLVQRRRGFLSCRRALRP